MSVKYLSYEEYHKSEIAILFWFFSFNFPEPVAVNQFDIRKAIMPDDSKFLFPKNSIPYRIDFPKDNLSYSVWVILEIGDGKNVHVCHYSAILLAEDMEKINSLIDLVWIVNKK